jgi:hypothetical protein
MYNSIRTAFKSIYKINKIDERLAEYCKVKYKTNYYLLYNSRDYKYDHEFVDKLQKGANMEKYLG